MEIDSKIYVAGNKGLVGSSIEKLLRKKGYNNIITVNFSELDLRDQKATEEFFMRENPEYVFMAAAKVGGIRANMIYTADFIYDNLQIQTNVIHSACKNKVKKLLFLGSSCIYPKNCPQPMKEEHLLTDKFEPTNEPYAVAKVAGIKMCQAYNNQYRTNFISVIPTNTFGPGDNFHLEDSHLIAALIRKFHEAKKENKGLVDLWGTGDPRREMIYVEDLADARIFLMENYNSSELINIGTGKDNSVRELAEIVKEVVGFEGEIKFDPTKPNGSMKKQLDTSKLDSLGWSAKTDLKEGIKRTYDWFLKNLS